jgi:uracil-DNA glycosylase
MSIDPDLIQEFRNYLMQQQALYGNELHGLRSSEGFDISIAASSSSILLPGIGVMPEQSDWRETTTLAELHDKIKDCMSCPLGETRNSFVFGVGNPNADIVIIGEAPGAEEDKKGEPFVGRAGKLLDDILKAVELSREDVFICNILKCRPPGNRDPQTAEVDQCEPYLHKQLEILKPKVMLALGRIAGQTLLKTKQSLTALRAETHSYQGIPLFVTYHPAALLRNPHWKRPTWEDIQKFKATYDSLTEGTKG